MKVTKRGEKRPQDIQVKEREVNNG